MVAVDGVENRVDACDDGLRIADLRLFQTFRQELIQRGQVLFALGEQRTEVFFEIRGYPLCPLLVV